MRRAGNAGCMVTDSCDPPSGGALETPGVRHSTLVEPRCDVGWVESDQPADFDVGDSPFGDEPADVTVACSEMAGELVDVE